MLRITERPLPASAASKLAEYQAEIDGKAAFAERVAEAKRLFPQRNRADNAVFREIRRVLDEMCSGARRCMYCEDSVADEVEHFKPKDFYPEAVFLWENYLYACGPCNGGKNNRFPLIAAATGQIFHLRRRPGDPILAPEAGNPALLDVRREDPLDFLQLDLRDTFFFQPRDSDTTSPAYSRAEQVIGILGLNARDYLPKARAEAFDSYAARLDQYVAWRQAGVEQSKLDRLAGSIRRMGHPTVWAEMKRQHQNVPQIRGLFERAPEAFGW